MKSPSTTGSWTTTRFAGRFRAPELDDSSDKAVTAERPAFDRHFEDRPAADISVPLHDADCPEPIGDADIFRVLNESVQATPERADLWMTRFETLRALGLKADFADYLKEVWRDPAVRARLEPAALARMWRELAGDEPPPAGVQLPRVPALAVVLPGADDGDCGRRFSDLAQRVAGAELAELVESYNGLRAEPDFFRAFARRVGPLLRRPTRLHWSAALSARYGMAARIYLKL